MKTSPKESFCSLQRGRPFSQTPTSPTVQRRMDGRLKQALMMDMDWMTVVQPLKRWWSGTDGTAPRRTDGRTDGNERRILGRMDSIYVVPEGPAEVEKQGIAVDRMAKSERLQSTKISGQTDHRRRRRHTLTLFEIGTDCYEI